MEFNIYNPGYLVLYSIFLIVMYLIIWIMFDTDKRKKHNRKSRFLQLMSVIPVVVAIIYEVGLGYFSDMHTSNYYPTMIFTGDFLQIAIPAIILLLASQMMKTDVDN